MSEWVSSVLRPHQHSIGYTETEKVQWDIYNGTFVDNSTHLKPNHNHKCEQQKNISRHTRELQTYVQTKPVKCKADLEATMTLGFL